MEGMGRWGFVPGLHFLNKSAGAFLWWQVLYSFPWIFTVLSLLSKSFCCSRGATCLPEHELILNEPNTCFTPTVDDRVTAGNSAAVGRGQTYVTVGDVLKGSRAYREGSDDPGMGQGDPEGEAYLGRMCTLGTGLRTQKKSFQNPSRQAGLGSRSFA